MVSYKLDAWSHSLCVFTFGLVSYWIVSYKLNAWRLSSCVLTLRLVFY